MALELFLIRGNSNQREKLELSDKYPAQPVNYVMEDEPVCLVLRSSEPLIQVVLWIQDLALAATDQNADDIDAVYQYFWGTPTQTRLFLNHFGSSNLTVDVLSPSLGIQYRYTSLEVFATKLNAMRAEGMLNYLERKLDDIVRSCFSATHHKAGIDTPYHERHASILMNEIRNGLDVLITNRSRFIERKRSRLVPEPRMQQWSSVNDISEQSIHWVLANLDVLTPSTSSSPFDVIINNRRFELERVQANVLHEDTDVYENQVVRGYLENIFLVLVEIERKYKELLVALENYDCLTDIPIGYQCLGEIRKKFGRKHYEKLLDECRELQQICWGCIYWYDAYLPVKRMIREEPKMTPGFEAYAHYRKVFDKIIQWYRIGKLSLSGDHFLYSLRTLDKLYEFYCLFQMVEALEYRGLKLEQTNYNQSKIKQHLKIEWDTEPANLFIFSGSGSQQVRLYYGHQIKPLHTENGTTLIDVFHTGNTIHSNWTPDFLIELKRHNSSVYAIFDSKYTKPRFAIERYLPELTMKYIHGIGSQYGGYSPVKALFFLCPRLETSDADFYQSYHNEGFGIFSNNPIIPALGGITLTPSMTNQIEMERERFVRILNQIFILLEKSLSGNSSL